MESASEKQHCGGASNLEKFYPNVRCCCYLLNTGNVADFNTCLSKSLIRKEILCHKNHMSLPQAKWNGFQDGPPGGI